MRNGKRMMMKLEKSPVYILTVDVNEGFCYVKRQDQPFSLVLAVMIQGAGAVLKVLLLPSLDTDT